MRLSSVPTRLRSARAWATAETRNEHTQGAPDPPGYAGEHKTAKPLDGSALDHDANGWSAYSLRCGKNCIIMGYLYRKAIQHGQLRKALDKCCRNVRWKPSVTGYEHNAQKNTYALAESLENGRYKIDRYQRFMVYEPKKREIVATRLKDRQFQRSLCDNVLYDAITRHFIADNCACLRGRGVDYALNRMTCHLERYYREQRAAAGSPALPWVADGWVLRCDIRHFFDSIPHDVAKAAIAKRVKDREAVRRVYDIIDSFGSDGHGIGLGSEVSQLVALAVLDDMDHLIKERLRIRHYIRYMDDFILVHPDRETLRQALAIIHEHLTGLGLELNGKTTIHPLRQGVNFLHWRFILTDSGKVVRKIDKAKISKERRKLRKLKEQVDAGRLTMNQVRDNYRSFKANALRGNTRSILMQMDQYYQQLFKEEPPHGKQKHGHPGMEPRAARCRSGTSGHGGSPGSQPSGSAGSAGLGAGGAAGPRKARQAAGKRG